MGRLCCLVLPELHTPGDSADTSNYSYDLMWRLNSAQTPPDPANSSMRAQNTFSFSSPNIFPFSVQRTKSVTTALSDVTTSLFDGLGRDYKGQHALPNGTATVDTTFDLAGHVATVSNPYFSTSDATYGIVTNAYDGLDRVTQVTRQDGSISRVQYNVATTIAVNGDCTISIDEAGKKRGACSDALGRLVEVDDRLARRIRYLRTKAGLSQSGMAHQFGIDRGNISEWENAKVIPSLPMLETLADGFKMSISELLKGV